MPLRQVRERRKRLGVGVRRSPRTVTLILLLIIVGLLIAALARVG